MGHHSVSTQHVAAAPAGKGKLLCAVGTEAGRVGMDGLGFGGEPAVGSSARHPQRQIDILVVEEDALVEAIDRLERISPIKGGTSGRAKRWRCSRDCTYRLPMQVVEAHQCDVGHHTGGIDEAWRVLLKKHSSHHLDPSTCGIEQGLDEAWLALGVVVQQDDWICGVLLDSSVDCGPKAKVPL
jgi:hypothetical protein